MKTKAIVVIMVLILCTLLSSPLFASGDHVFTGGNGQQKWTNSNLWDPDVPDSDTDKVYLEALCEEYDPAGDAETVTELYLDTAVGSGTLTVDTDKTLNVLGFVRMGDLQAGGKLNIDGGTVVVGGAGSEYAVEFDYTGQGATTQINVTNGGLLKLYAGDDTSSEGGTDYRYVIRFASDYQTISSTLTVSGTGVMEFYKTIDALVPAIGHTDNSAGPITVADDGYIKYVGCDAMDMIAEDADDNGGVFKGVLGAATQRKTPQDVLTQSMAYDQDTDDRIAWFCDGTDTYLFPCAQPDGMTQIDAGDGGSRTVQEGAAGFPLECTLDKASDDTTNYTFVWECNPSEGVTYAPSPNVEDPNVYFETSGVYTLKVTATSDVPTYVISDWVTYGIDVKRANIMVTHLAIDAGELKAAEDNNWSNFPRADAEYFKDSSLEGNPENHHMVTQSGNDGWDDKQGVVGCGSNDSLYSDDDGAIKLYLNHQVSGFNEGAAHLDNIDTAITVALWYKGEDDKSQVLIEKEDTFSLEIDRGESKIQVTIWKQAGGSETVTSKNRQLAGDLTSDNLHVRGNDNSDGDAWHHVAFSYDSTDGRLKMYIDGALIKDDTAHFDPGDLIATHSNIKYLTIGGKVGSSDDLRKGGLDDIRIYNYALEDYEIAELAAMGESVAMVYAGKNRVIALRPPDPEDPNDIGGYPVQLRGAYIKLGRGTLKVSSGGQDERIGWDMRWGSGTATFSNSSDPRATVTFSEPGIKTLRLTARERFCGSDNDTWDNVTIEILAPTNCAQYLLLDGADPGDLDGDCDVDLDDFVIIAENYWNVSYP